MIVIRHAREQLGIDTAAFAKKANLDTGVAYRLQNEAHRAGLAIRTRVAQALDRPETELFDPSGWPLEVAGVAS